jgi:hypothetical protein
MPDTAHAAADPGRPLSDELHTLLEQRRVGLSFCASVLRWTEGGGRGVEDLVRHLDECRRELALQTVGACPTPADSGLEQERRLVDAALAAVRTTNGSSLAARPLQRLARAMQSPQAEIDALLLASLPEESSVWCTLFSRLLRDPAVQRPSVHIAARALGRSVRSLASSALVHFGLLALEPASVPLAGRSVRLADHAWPALCGLQDIDPTLVSCVVPAPSPPVAPIFPEEVQARADAIAASLRRQETMRIVVCGARGVGRRSLARSIGSSGGWSLIEIRVVQGADPSVLAAAFRHAVVRGSGLLLVLDPHADIAEWPLPVPEGIPVIVVVGERTRVIGPLFDRASILHVPRPTLATRTELWRRAGVDLPRAGELALRFSIPGGDIDAAMRAAHIAARVDGRETIEEVDVVRAVRDRPAMSAEPLARRRVPRAVWSDLVLPPPMIAQLEELCRRLRFRDRVFEQWQVDAHGTRQNGVLSLFTGPSGTGKTLAAEVLASRLDLDLYSIDLSQVVSKYIGETEKNLARVFDAVDETGALLFFDEADSLFGKRTETRDAHDRYANLEVSYLLARIEAFRGVAVLASNFRQNIDGAFLRRMDFVIEFAQPDGAARRRLWDRHLRCGAPLAADIDVAKLVEAFPVSGAHIRNAVVAAAFAAASDGGVIGQTHVLAGMHREYEKLGKAFPAALLAASARRA